MSFDLHAHSDISDGTQPPAEVVASAKRAGLQGMALTDHDTTAGWSEAVRAAQEHQILVIPGMEITTLTEDRISVHLLSYLHDPAHPELSAAIRGARQGRQQRARAMVERLAQDFPISWEAVDAQVSDGATIGRPHLADALVAAGVVTDRQQAFDQLLHRGSPYYVSQENIHPVEAIRLVSAAGGVPVIAHAMASTRGRTVSGDQLEEMVEAGLAGVEVWHRDNPEEGRQRLLELARRHDLLTTGSSDYHGAGKPNLLGENTTDLHTVERLLERATGSTPAGTLPLH